MQTAEKLPQQNGHAAVSGEQGEISSSAGAASLEDTLARKQAYIDKLRSQNEDLRIQKDQLESVLKDVVNSASWRLTEPLRAAKRALSAILPLWRRQRIALELRPARNTVLNQDGEISIVGPSPNCSVVLPAKISLPGWARIKGRISTKNDFLSFFFYFGDSKEFNELKRHCVTFSPGASQEYLLRIPKGTSALRLDPFITEGAFRFETLQLELIGSLQLLFSIAAQQFKFFISNPAAGLVRIRRAIALLRSGGLPALRGKLFSQGYADNYEDWVRRYDTINDNSRKQLQNCAAQLKSPPLISVIMPTYNTPEQYLRLAIDSVRAQAYQNWELCVADDASTEPHIAQILEHYSKLDQRIRYVVRQSNGHISAATNSALELARGEYIALLDHDDELTEDALLSVALEIATNPEAELIYSDEDKKTSFGLRFNPYFKPDFNHELFLQQNFVCHLAIYKTATVRQLGGLRSGGYEGAQDWDLALRVIARCGQDKVRHIPQILYHWRVIEGSTAQSTEFKPYVLEAQRRAVSDYLATLARPANVEIRSSIAQLKISYPIASPQPLVSIIIPTHDQLGLLQRCVNSIIDKTTYDAYEIIIVDNASVEDSTISWLDQISQNARVRVIKDPLPFNFARINNDAAKHARGEILAFLNNDLSVISNEWLAQMVSHLSHAETGVVGAKLLYPNDMLQHGGVILGIGGVAGHSHKNFPRHDVGYFNRLVLTQNASAVTAACMLVRRADFERLEGFDAETFAVAFNDIDLCLRFRAAGFGVVFCPDALLYHYESASRGLENTPEKFSRFEREIEHMKERWGDVLKNDPFYNPNLSLLREDFSFSFPPRRRKLWQ